MLGAREVSRLLRAASGDLMEVRLAGVSAAVRLPLDEGAWDVVAREVLALLDTVPLDSGLRAEIVRVASLVPVDSVRAALTDAAAGEGPAAALVRSILHRESAEDAAALVAAAASGDAAAAEHLARVPVEDFDVDVTPLRDVAERGDPEMRFWGGLTLARRGDTTVFDAVLQRLDNDPPDFMWGSPWAAYDVIAAIRPLPAALIAHLLGKLDELGDTRLPLLVVRAATGVADAAGTPAIAGEPDHAAGAEEHAAAGETERAHPEDVGSLLDDIDLASHEWDPERLARLSPDAAGDIVIGLLTRLADVAAPGAPEEPYAYAFGNGLVQVVASLPDSVDVPVSALADLDIHALTTVVDDAQVAYALAAAGSARVCRAFEGRLSAAADPGEKTRMFHLLEAVGGFETGERDAPLLGAGPGGGAEIPFPETVFDFSAPPTGDEPMASAGAPPGEVSGGGPGAVAGEPAAKRTAWPHLSCEVVVVAGAVFPVEVGLRGDRDPKVEGTGALSVPAGSFTLEVELMLDPDGFAVVGDRVVSLDVTPDDPHPTTTVQLVAIAGQELARDRRVGATFRVGGEIRGYAARNVAVVASAEEAPSTEPPAQPVPASPSNVSELPPGEAADLSITISRGDDMARTKLLWSMSSPLIALDVPEQTLASDVGESPQAFLAEIVKAAGESVTALSFFSALEGAGRAKIASKIPPEVQAAIREVIAAAAPDPPTILFLTEDPYIPWELAVLDRRPPEGGGVSPFLGAGAVVARWPLRADQRPPPLPEADLTVGDHAVVTAVYHEVAGWNRLDDAEAEGETLLGGWPQARRVEPSFEDVLACIRGEPPADVIHFALHGSFQLQGIREGLVLIGHPDGRPEEKVAVYLRPDNVNSGDLSGRRPLVFLNACQVGAGKLVLGDYSGMAEAFLFAGATAVVAALWSIDDSVASDVAVEFYERALGAGVSPAEILRAERAKVTEDAIKRKDQEASVTRLAYQFFGHPRMQLLHRDQT